MVSDTACWSASVLVRSPCSASAGDMAVAAASAATTSAMRCMIALPIPKAVVCRLRRPEGSACAVRLLDGDVQLAAARLELRGFRRQPGFDLERGGILAHVLRDAHRTEMRSAHRAEVRHLGPLRRQRLVV